MVRNSALQNLHLGPPTPLYSMVQPKQHRAPIVQTLQAIPVRPQPTSTINVSTATIVQLISTSTQSMAMTAQPSTSSGWPPVGHSVIPKTPCQMSLQQQSVAYNIPAYVPPIIENYPLQQPAQRTQIPNESNYHAIIVGNKIIRRSYPPTLLILCDPQVNP